MCISLFLSFFLDMAVSRVLLISLIIQCEFNAAQSTTGTLGIEPVAIVVTILVILGTIIAIIVIVVLVRRKCSHAGTANDEIHDEIPDVTKRQDLQQVTDIILTDSNPATSHLPTSFKEMEPTRNYVCVPTHTPVEPNSHREGISEQEEYN